MKIMKTILDIDFSSCQGGVRGGLYRYLPPLTPPWQEGNILESASGIREILNFSF